MVAHTLWQPMHLECNCVGSKLINRSRVLPKQMISTHNKPVVIGVLSVHRDSSISGSPNAMDAAG